MDAPNAIVTADRDQARRELPWTEWLDPDGSANWTGAPVDLFEGTPGWWHPQGSCHMNDRAHERFCVVCAEALPPSWSVCRVR